MFHVRLERDDVDIAILSRNLHQWRHTCDISYYPIHTDNEFKINDKTEKA